MYLLSGKYSVMPGDWHCVEAVFHELRQQCAELRRDSAGLLSEAGCARFERELHGSFRQFLILERRSWRPVATFSLRASWHNSGVISDIESEFDLRAVLGPAGRYLHLEGFGFLPELDVSAVLSMALRQTRKLYGSLDLAGISGRVRLPLGGGDKYIQSLMHKLRHVHHCTRQIAARVALRRTEVVAPDDVILPHSLHAWLRQGACVGSEPYWDAEQGQVRLLTWLPMDQWRPVFGGLRETRCRAMPVGCPDGRRHLA